MVMNIYATGVDLLVKLPFVAIGALVYKKKGTWPIKFRRHHLDRERLSDPSKWI